MKTIETDIVVVGAGPGGYAAAFYAADQGHRVFLVDPDARLGGVCLNRGCIPSKALLGATRTIREARHASTRGIHFDDPRIELSELRSWKESIIDKLSMGVQGLAKGRGVQVLRGRGYFEGSQQLRVETDDGQETVKFEHGIIAVGSRPAIPSAFDLGNPRVMTSTEALELEDVPDQLLIVGGGYIGMELGTVYAGLGSDIVVVEALDSILAGADPDLVRPVLQNAEAMFREIRLRTPVQSMSTSGDQIRVTLGVNDEQTEELYDRVLIAVGRRPNCDNLGIQNTGVTLDEKGFIEVDDQQRTSDTALFAIGDAAGGMLLAHKASREGRVAVEALDGEHSTMQDVVIPAVVFTDPEIAWCGLTESDAKKDGLDVQVARFSWSASGRALSMDRTDGLTKLVIEKETERILGVGIVGVEAGEMISEGVLAVEMGAAAMDLTLVSHPHPTLSETLMECAESFYGHATHRMSQRSK